MSRPAGAPPPRRFIIRTGFTSRLIEADSEEIALHEFKHETPMRSVLLMDVAEELRIHEATEEEVAEFQRSRKRQPIEGQTEMEFGDVRLTPAQKKAKKEHA